MTTGTTTLRRDDPARIIAMLQEKVARQEAMINALTSAVERRLGSTEEGSAINRFEGTLALHAQVRARTERIRAAERLMRSVVDALDARMCILGKDGQILGTNRMWSEFAERVGWPVDPNPGEVCVYPLLADLGEPLAAEVADGVRAVVERQVAFANTDGQFHRDGVNPLREHLTVRIHAVQDHTEARAVLVLVDISSEVAIKQELDRITDRAHLLALVAQHTDNGVMIQDVDGRIAWVNEAFCRLNGYQPADVIGRYRRDLLTTPHARTPAFRELEAAIGAARPADVQFPTQTREGQTYWVHVQVQPIFEEGRLLRFVSVERDITAQRAAVDQLRAATRQAHELTQALGAEKGLLTEVLRAIPHLVYWKDLALRYTGVNQAFLDLRGLGDETQVTGRHEDELAADDELGRVLRRVEPTVLADGTAVQNERVVLIGGAVLLLSVLPRLDEHGRPCGLIGVATDVTHVSALEQQLAQATRLESIGQLAAGVAHEINTPVQYVSDNTRFLSESFTELLGLVQEVKDAGRSGRMDRVESALAGVDLEFLAGEIPDALTQCQEGLSRVSQIVRAMKDFSHPGQDRVDADLNRAVESTAQVSRNEWRYVADLELELDPAVGTIRCHEGELKQVLLNIVVNAAQAIAEGREARAGEQPGLGKIVVTTARTPQGVRITVSDDGPGMPEAVRLKIFDPFFTTKPIGKGTGQGLSMAYAVIVQKHGGKLSVRSAPGQGTTFTIELPDDLPVEG